MFGTSCEGLHVAATQSLIPSMDLLCLASLKQFLSGTVGIIGKSTVIQLFYSWFMYGDITVVSLMQRGGVCNIRECRILP